MSKPNVRIPQPDRVRRIAGSFAWIDHRLLRNGYLAAMTHQDQSLYLFLALAADRHGVSFYRKEKICDLLGLDFGEFEVARDRLINLRLIAFAPYSALSVNGFHQVLPIEGPAPDLLALAPVAASSPIMAPPAPTAAPASLRAAASKPPAAAATAPPRAAQTVAAAPPSVADMAAQLANAFRSV